MSKLPYVYLNSEKNNTWLFNKLYNYDYKCGVQATCWRLLLLLNKSKSIQCRNDLTLCRASSHQSAVLVLQLLFNKFKKFIDWEFLIYGYAASKGSSVFKCILRKHSEKKFEINTQFSMWWVKHGTLFVLTKCLSVSPGPLAAPMWIFKSLECFGYRTNQQIIVIYCKLFELQNFNIPF